MIQYAFFPRAFQRFKLVNNFWSMQGLKNALRLFGDQSNGAYTDFVFNKTKETLLIRNHELYVKSLKRN